MLTGINKNGKSTSENSIEVLKGYDDVKSIETVKNKNIYVQTMNKFINWIKYIEGQPSQSKKSFNNS